jgi:hypothetical protein
MALKAVKMFDTIYSGTIFRLVYSDNSWSRLLARKDLLFAAGVPLP